MIFFFLTFFLLSKEIGVLVVGSTKTISYICDYVLKSKLEISFSYVGQTIDTCKDYRFENVDYLKFPLTAILDKGEESSFSRFKTIPFKKDFFKCAYDRYLNHASSKGIFVEGGALDLDMIEHILSSYTWFVGGVSHKISQNVYVMDEKNFLIFELIKSTNQIEFSSSSLFLLDERVYPNISEFFVELEKSRIKFLSVSAILDTLQKSTDTFKSKSYLVEFIRMVDINYLIYLNRVFSDLLDSKSIKLVGNMCEFFDFYPIDLARDETYNEIRGLTHDLYFISSKNIPLFVYDDFLENTIKMISVEKTESSLKYEDEKDIFSIEVDSMVVSFSISNSTPVEEIHIYGDMNKRPLQGLTTVIGKRERISDTNAWEYAFIISNDKVKLYNSLAREYRLIKEFKTEKDNSFIKFSIPKDYLKGNPINWCFIVIFWNNENYHGFFTKLNPNIFGCND